MSELEMGEEVGCTNESLKERMKESIDSNHAKRRKCLPHFFLNLLINHDFRHCWMLET